jgi:hypothetical protein
MRLALAAAAVVALAACGDASDETPDAGPAPTVGPEGGTLTSIDGRATLVVPAGALAAPAAVTLMGIPGTSLPLEPGAVGQSAYHVAPDGVSFSRPATLSITYDLALGPAGASDHHLRLFTIAERRWQAIGESPADGERHVASGPITTGGTYAVAWAGPARACDAPEDAQFDFWVGHWEWIGFNGQLVGPNDISREANGCVIREEFLNGQGRSISFRGDDGRWHQTYVTSGSRLPMSGEWDGRRMLLTVNPTSRFYWRPISADRVAYNGESSDDGGVTWRLAAESEYRRR